MWGRPLTSTASFIARRTVTVSPARYVDPLDGNDEIDAVCACARASCASASPPPHTTGSRGRADPPMTTAIASAVLRANAEVDAGTIPAGKASASAMHRMRTHPAPGAALTDPPLPSLAVTFTAPSPRPRPLACPRRCARRRRRSATRADRNCRVASLNVTRQVRLSALVGEVLGV